jgi:polysaccharide export outer membrane protein
MTGFCGKWMGEAGVRAVALTILAMAAGGCTSQIDFERPFLSSPFEDLFVSPKPYVPAGKAPADVRDERLAKVLSAWETRPKVEEAQHRISPGDTLEVGIFALEDMDKATTLKRTVTREGTITLPWTGTIQVNGLLPKDVEDRIRETSKRYIKNPQCTVMITEGMTTSVLVTGAVSKPGMYSLKDCGTVLHLLSNCGGLTEDAGDEMVITREGQRTNPATFKKLGSASPKGGGLESELSEEEQPPKRESGGQSRKEPERIVIDLKQLLEEGNLLFNMELASGDLVSVPPRIKKYVHIMGFVRNPGSYEMTEYGRLDIVQAVALGGGLDSRARAENSYLLRQTSSGRQRIPVDLIKIYKGSRPPVYMEDGDVVVVGTDWIVRMMDALRPSLDTTGPPWKTFSTGVGAIR